MKRVEITKDEDTGQYQYAVYQQHDSERKVLHTAKGFEGLGEAIEDIEQQEFDDQFYMVAPAKRDEKNAKVVATADSQDNSNEQEYNAGLFPASGETEW